MQIASATLLCGLLQLLVASLALQRSLVSELEAASSELTALLTERDESSSWVDDEQVAVKFPSAHDLLDDELADEEQSHVLEPVPAPEFASQGAVEGSVPKRNTVSLSKDSRSSNAISDEIDDANSQLQPRFKSQRFLPSKQRLSARTVPSASRPANRLKDAKSVLNRQQSQRQQPRLSDRPGRLSKFLSRRRRGQSSVRPMRNFPGFKIGPDGSTVYEMKDFHGWTKVYVGFTVPIWELRGIQSGLERWAASQATTGIDAFASVIGSGTGLMMVPILKPKKAVLYELNEEGVKWGKLLYKLIQISTSPQELVTRIFGRSVMDWEKTNGKMTEKNQNKYLDMPQDGQIFSDTLAKLANDADEKEAYAKLLVHEISKGARKFDTVAGSKKEWTRCFYPMYLGIKDFLDTSNTGRTSDHIEVCRVLGYGMFYMKDQQSYDSFKTGLASTQINFVKASVAPESFADDVCGMLGSSQSTAINTMDIFAKGPGACHVFKGGENDENAVTQEMWKTTANQCGSKQLLWIQESSSNKLNNLQNIDLNGQRHVVSIDQDYTNPTTNWKAFLNQQHYPDVAVARMQVEAAQYYESNNHDEDDEYQQTMTPKATLQLQQEPTNARNNAELVRDLANFFTKKMGIKPSLFQPIAKAYNAVDRKYYFPSVPPQKVYDMEYGLRFGPKPASTTDGPWMFMNGLLRSLPYLQDRKKVLDIGTGSGHTTTVLAALTGGEVWSTEVDPDLVKRAQSAFATCQVEGGCDRSLINKVHWMVPDSTSLLKAHAPYDLIHGSTQRYQMGVNERTKGTYITKWIREPKTREKHMKIPAAVLDQLAPNGVYIPYYYPDETIIVERNLKGELIADAIPTMISRSDANKHIDKVHI